MRQKCVCVLCCQKRSTITVCGECEEHYCECMGPHDQQPDKPAKTTNAHPRLPHQTQKTKAHNKTPQKTPTKTTPPPKKKKATPTSPQSKQQADGTAAFTADTKHKGKGKGPSKTPQGKGKK